MLPSVIGDKAAFDMRVVRVYAEDGPIVRRVGGCIACLREIDAPVLKTPVTGSHRLALRYVHT